jgi:hypothetical protein
MADYGNYQTSVEPEALPGRPYPRFPDAVSPQSTGEAIGRGIEDVGAVAQQHYDAVMSQARQAQLTDAHNQFQTLSLSLTHDPQTGAFTKQGKDAFGLPDQYLPQYDQQAQQIIDNVPDPRARQAAQLAAAQVRGHLAEQLDTYELDQHRQFNLQTAKSSVALAQQVGPANYNHPDILAANLDHIDASLENLAKQQGLSVDDPQIQEARQEARSTFHSNVIDRMLGDGKTQLADAYLKTTQGELDARTFEALSSRIGAKEKEAQNEAKQDVADRYQDSMEAAMAGLKNPLTVSRGELNILFPKDAQRHWDGLQSMTQAGAQSKEYDKMTADQIHADLDARRPTQGGPEAAFQLRSYDILDRAAQRSLAARRDDPAQFAIDSGQGWQALDFRAPQNIPQQLRSRANSAGQVSDQIGGPVSLLTKPEAKAFGTQLATQPPSQQLALLSTLRSSLPTEGAYESILHQVAPASPVLAVAGQMLDPPSRNTPTWYNPQFGANPVVGERILRGEQILNGKGEEKAGTSSATTGTATSGFAIPKDTELYPAFNEHIGNLFQGRAQTAEVYYHAFRDYYAAAAEAAGDTSGTFNKGLARQAAEAVMGHPVQYGTSDLRAPHGMDPTLFEGSMDRAVNDALEQAGYGAREKELLRGYGVRELGGTLGSGRYALVNSEGQPLKTPDGSEPVIVDLRQSFPRAIGVIQRAPMEAVQ